MNKYQRFHSKNDWENIDVTSINREYSHSPWGAYENTVQASTCDPDSSRWRMSLDGIWKFAYHSKPADVDCFWKDDYDHSDWKDIIVPGNWEIQGFGEPIYTNTLYPWNYYSKEKHLIYPDGTQGVRGLPNPPYIPEENPTGCYSRVFHIPAEWLKRDVFIYFKGVETAYYLWINGKEAGYSQDSKLPSEFNIAPYIKEGENSISLQVMRFADSIYLEDQDYWHLSGVFRSVSLLAKPKARITDWMIDAIPDPHYPFGVVKADVSVNRFNGFAKYRIKLDIMDMEDKILASEVSEINPRPSFKTTEKPAVNTARFQIKVENVYSWTPETPVLYKAVMTLISPDDEEVDFESCRIGFRQIEIIDGVILLNKKRLIVRGVNRHEHEACGGHTVTKEHMVKEIKLMKKLGINSVRTCHYPDDPIWYDLCDEWGILLICECNLETHGVEGALTQNPAWGTSFLERAIRMVVTYKNHPSIYSWSLGNESGVGANHAGMAGWIKEYDTTRLCQYESGTPGRNISDIRGNMYATQKVIMQMLTDVTDIRPIVLVEYLYQIRNSGGGMYKFYELVENYKRFQGGYIWDWQDKCLMAKTAQGIDYYAYGGDFNETVKDWQVPGFMTNNGIVLPDLTLKPVAMEVKQIYCPIIFEEVKPDSPWVSETATGNYYVKNRNLVLDTKPYKVTYTVRENGYVIKTGLLELPCLKAGEDTVVSFAADFEKKPDMEYHIEFSVKYAVDTAYAQTDYELGCYQFRVDSKASRYNDAGSTVNKDHNNRVERKPDEEDPAERIISIKHLSNCLNVTGANLSVAFDDLTGIMTSCANNGVEYILSGPAECFTRPFTGIDAKEGWGRFGIWQVFDNKNIVAVLKEFSAEPLGNMKAVINTVREIRFIDNPYEIFVFTSYTISSDARITVKTVFKIDPSLKDLPRAGVEIVIPEGFEAIKYFGLGPLENYRDRKHSAKLGVFESMVKNEHFPFIPPSECGGHEDTRWVTLTNSKGRVLKISAPVPFHFDVHHNTIGDYKESKHDHELLRRKESYLHIDAAHSGIGSDMGWSTFLSDKEKVMAQNYSMEFTISME